MKRLPSLFFCGFCTTFLVGCSSNNSQNALPSQNTPSANGAAPAGQVITPSGSTNFSSKAAKFSIHFPSKPVEQRVSDSSEWGNYEMFTFRSDTRPVTYIVIATTIPPKVDTSDAEDFIDGVQKGLLQGSGGKLQKSQGVTLNSIPGRELHTTLQEGAALSRVYIYLTPKISYQVMAVGLKKEFQSQKPQIDKVLTSFRLLDK